MQVNRLLAAAGLAAFMLVISACTNSEPSRGSAGNVDLAQQSVLTDVYPLSQSVFSDVYDSRALSKPLGPQEDRRRPPLHTEN